ncbi:MAG TPA: hypothetical protein VL282_11385 [Tepidisphaeraceae bacterium]|nr:hypothetical protein [Tepidisphaeraceae bacterium]
MSRESVPDVVMVGAETWPSDVRDLLERLDQAFPKLHDRRVIPRWAFHVAAFLTIEHAARHQIWTRDINPWNVGFVSRESLTSGATGTLRFEVPGGQIIVVAGQVKRSREFQTGWFEGYINFLQPISPEAIERTKG